MSSAGRPKRGADRYLEPWGEEFWASVNAALEPGSSVLDLGGGRRPTIAPDDRPADCHYVGFDVAGEELELAPDGAYDETVIGDAATYLPALENRFDLIVSWQVLEHVADLEAAAAALRRYLRPGGSLVALLSGRHAAYAIANRLLPDTVGRGIVSRLMRRDLDEVFPAHYDLCDARGLRRAFAPWEALDVVPLWRGADYFEPFPRLRSLYIRYEDWAIGRSLDNLATHYAVRARR